MSPPSWTPLPPLTPVHPSRLITEPRGGAPCVRQQIPTGCPHFQLFHPKRSRTVSVSVRALVYLHLAGSHVGLVPELSCWESLRLRVNSCWWGDAWEDKENQRVERAEGSSPVSARSWHIPFCSWRLSERRAVALGLPPGCFAGFTYGSVYNFPCGFPS